LYNLKASHYRSEELSMLYC